MNASRWYYICDGCGNLVTIADAPLPDGEEWACDTCGCGALWEFTNQEHAMQHARHIQRLAQSGIFRRAR